MTDKLRSNGADGEEQQPGFSPELFLEGIRPSLDALAELRGRADKALVSMTPALIAIGELGDLLAKVIVPNLAGVAERLHELVGMLPPNWRTPLDFDLAFQVMQEEGIPLVWVPRADIVAQVLAAPNRDARLTILTARSSDVLQDCRDALDQITRPSLVRILPMAVEALDAFMDGHHASAQALAVLIVETVVTREYGGYSQAKERAKIDDPRELGLMELRLRAALAPIGPFYVSWRPNSGNPMPEELSRHVTVHQADPDHFTLGNAMVAIMLLASVLRGLDKDRPPA